MAADDRLTRALKILAAIALGMALAVAVLAFLHKIIAVVIIVGGAVFFAYLVYPIVRLFSRRMPRWLAIVCVYAILFVVIGSLFASIGPRLAAEARAFAADFPRLMQQTQDWMLNANTTLLGAIPIEARETVLLMFNAAGSSLQKAAGAIAGQALSVLLGLASMAAALVIIPILAFYILIDTERLRSGFFRLIPANAQPTAHLILQDIDNVLGGFIRGQIIVAASVAVLITIILLILQIKYALLIGVFAGAVDIIPYLGAIAGAIPAVIIALITHGFGWALLVVGAFVVVNQVEGHIIVPNVVGQRVGLTPFMVIVSILIGAELGGILGMFVAVPVAAIIKALAVRFLPPAPGEPVLTQQPEIKQRT
ncbi:MAG TPA: AI-2E family transporter [Candidatus Acidoferrales bacterium]|nr:AI-2E family transporter [Candidatus Acidoferrales bacterium]